MEIKYEKPEDSFEEDFIDDDEEEEYGILPRIKLSGRLSTIRT